MSHLRKLPHTHQWDKLSLLKRAMSHHHNNQFAWIPEARYLCM